MKLMVNVFDFMATVIIIILKLLHGGLLICVWVRRQIRFSPRLLLMKWRLNSPTIFPRTKTPFIPLKQLLLLRTPWPIPATLRKF